jgi:transposase-like protein
MRSAARRVKDAGSDQTWIEEIDALSEAQRQEVQTILAGRSAAAEGVAALDGRPVAERVCPHCRRLGAVCRGRAKGWRRFSCAGCGRTFNTLTGTPLASLHDKGRRFAFARSPSGSETVRTSAAPCAAAVSTGFRWRHHFLQAIKTNTAALNGSVEADATDVLESRKGSRAWNNAAAGQSAAEAPARKPRKADQRQQHRRQAERPDPGGVGESFDLLHPIFCIRSFASHRVPEWVGTATGRPLPRDCPCNHDHHASSAAGPNPDPPSAFSATRCRQDRLDGCALPAATRRSPGASKWLARDRPCRQSRHGGSRVLARQVKPRGDRQ